MRLFIALTIALSTPVFAQTFESGHERVSVIELFTSEGCSSCPPADRYVRSFAEHPGLWETFIPLAFHVDYWDYLGWHDPFASAEFSDRQREYRSEGGLGSVYTPGFVINGREWRGFFRGARIRDFDSSASGNLTLTVNDASVAVEYKPRDARNKPLRVTVALVGFDLISHVPAGENRGKSLRHDFVVLGTHSQWLERNEESQTASLALPRPSATAHRQAVVAWVTEADKQTPLQATGGYLESPVY